MARKAHIAFPFLSGASSSSARARQRLSWEEGGWDGENFWAGVRGGGQNGRKGDETPSGMRLNKRKIFGGKCTENFAYKNSLDNNF